MGEGIDADALFSALAHESRRRVIKALGEKGELTFTEMMEVAGIEETGTFGFHLKKMEPLLEKGDFGKYLLSELGKIAYNILKYMETREFPEKQEVTLGEPRVIRGVDMLIVTRELLEERPVIIRNCDTVIFESDIDVDIFKKRVLSLSHIDTIEVPKHLYKVVFSKIEGDVDTVTYYEGLWKQEKVHSITCFSKMIVDLNNMTEKFSITNFGLLKLENLNDENLDKIAEITNFGIIMVPKGYREKIFRKMIMNAGNVEEYEIEEKVEE